MGTIGNAKPQGIGSEKPYGPESLHILGPDVVTEGIKSTFECSAKCSPNCTYSWTVDGEIIHGSGLYMTILDLKSQVLNCVAQNPATGVSASINKTVQVAEGPLNVTITTPKMLVGGDEYTFVCSAVCSPSCNYTWYIDDQTWKNSNEVHYMTPAESTSVTVICKAQNTLSGLFMESIHTVLVAQGPQEASIRGPSAVMVGATVPFYCFANCIPACNITWRFEGKTLSGDPVSVPILEQEKSVLGNMLDVSVESFFDTQLLQCTVVNTLSGKSYSITKVLNVTDTVGVKPITATQPRANSSYSLQCVGAEQGSEIQWTKNGEALSTSDIHFSDNNAILSFEPLHPSDSGEYQCVVKLLGKTIPGIPYQINVIYGPVTAEMTISGGHQVQSKLINDLLLLAGSSATFTCSSECYPACTYEWLLEGNVVSTDATFSISSASVATEGVLTCTATNPDVQTLPISSASASVLIELIDGPKNITISGPNSVQVGVKATFECSAVCTPPCFYTWEVYGKTLHGSNFDLTISKYVATETLICKAENTFTEKVATADVIIDVTDPDWCGC
ncbi:carcinoembryonic antigen-related cell adhesion molecule 20-like isoform X2 [Sardina pilchardus]|uniref:carcinoembryonic antigen-related cell adhesion molecule 20-like isoform X2 n=1 Tax=Sardina pilchardus TaxID=27697 RepID=UPI002E0E61FC